MVLPPIALERRGEFGVRRRIQLFGVQVVAKDPLVERQRAERLGHQRFHECPNDGAVLVRDDGCDTRRDFGLHREQLCRLPVERLRPEMLARLRIEQPSRYPHLRTGGADAAFDDKPG